MEVEFVNPQVPYGNTRSILGFQRMNLRDMIPIDSRWWWEPMFPGWKLRSQGMLKIENGDHWPNVDKK